MNARLWRRLALLSFSAAHAQERYPPEEWRGPQARWLQTTRAPICRINTLTLPYHVLEPSAPEERRGPQARWLQTTRAPIRRITFQWRDRAPVAVHGSISDGGSP